MSSVPSRLPRWPERVVMLVTDRRQLPVERWPDVIGAAIGGGVNVVQLREKDMPAGELLPTARRIRGVTLGRALLIINDRADVALLAGADGVQLPEDGLPPAAVRAWLPRSMVVGRSVHDINGARQAEQDGADYLVVGPIFATPSKAEAKPGGAALLADVVSRVNLPVIAIGGITGENAAECWAAGAAGVAAISSLLRAGDPHAAAAALAAVEGAEA